MAKLLLVPGSTRNFDEVCFALLSASEMRAAPLQPSAWADFGGPPLLAALFGQFLLCLYNGADVFLDEENFKNPLSCSFCS